MLKLSRSRNSPICLSRLLHCLFRVFFTLFRLFFILSMKFMAANCIFYSTFNIRQATYIFLFLFMFLLSQFFPLCVRERSHQSRHIRLPMLVMWIRCIFPMHFVKSYICSMLNVYIVNVWAVASKRMIKSLAVVQCHVKCLVFRIKKLNKFSAQNRVQIRWTHSNLIAIHFKTMLSAIIYLILKHICELSRGAHK